MNDPPLAEKGGAIPMVEQPVIVTQAGVELINEHKIRSPSLSETLGNPSVTLDPALTAAGIKFEERIGA